MITQADRNAAADLHIADCGLPISPYDRKIEAGYRAGEHDNWNDVLAFAAHAATARREALMEAAAIATSEVRLGYEGYDLTGFHSENTRCRSIAKAILALLEKGE